MQIRAFSTTSPLGKKLMARVNVPRVDINLVRPSIAQERKREEEWIERQHVREMLEAAKRKAKEDFITGQMKMAHRIIDRSFGPGVVQPGSIRDIQKACAHRFGIPLSFMTNETRMKEIIIARHIAYYLCRKHTRSSFPFIGKLFERDHTSILHGFRKVEAVLAGKHGDDAQSSYIGHIITIESALGLGDAE